MLLAPRLRPVLTVVSVAVAIAVACTDGTDPNGHSPLAHGATGYVPVTSVQITLKASSLIAGQTTQATAVAKDFNGLALTGRTATWTSLNPSVVTVSTSGLVTAVAPGSATIRATVESVSGDAALSATPVPIANIAVSLPPAMRAGQTTQASAVVTDTNGVVLTGQTLTWSSSNPSVATVSPSGLVTAVAIGTAAIRATEEGHFGEAPLSVPAPVAAVAVSLSTNALTVGQTAQATAVASDSAGTILTGRSVSWTSLSPDVATVSSTGVVTAVTSGTATIRATVESKTGDASLSVAPIPVATVTATLGAPTLTVGQSTQATAVATDASGNALTGRVVAWSSLNPGVATVSSTGVVTAVTTGSATIRATVESKTGDASLSVSAIPVAIVTATLGAPSLTAGQSTQAFALAKDASGNPLTGRVITWSSLNPGVATVSPSGMVTAVAAGAATIRATVESKIGDASLSVTSAPAPASVATVTATLTATSLTAGQTTQAVAVAKDGSGNALTGRVVVWSSLNSGVATVSPSGMVTAVAAGSATIRATVETKTGDAALTVSTSTVAVANVSVSIGSSNLTVGQTSQAVVVATDASGNVLTGRPVSWSSATPSVATVSSAGLVTAVANGTANIQATVETKVGSAVVTVATTPAYTPPVGHPNEPAGMTMLLTHDGSAVQPTAAWDAAYADPTRGSLGIVIDPEKGNVLQLATTPRTIPGEGSGYLVAGSASSNTYASAFAPTKVYLSWYEKLSPNYVGNDGSGGGKDIWMQFQHAYIGDAWLIAFDNQIANGDLKTANVKSHFDLYNVVAFNGNTFPSTSGVAILPEQGAAGDPGNIRPRNTWVFFEVVVTLPSRNTPNGEVQMWINGVAYPKTAAPYVNEIIGLHATGIQLGSDAGPRLTSVAIVNTWGGGGSVLPVDNWNRYKDIYLSGGYARAGEQPDHWVVALAAGQTATPAAGSSVELVAQLVDGNGNSVDVFGQTLQPTLHVTGPATVARHADPAGNPYTAESHGRVLIRVDVPAGATSGQDIAVSLDDYAKITNGTVNGNQRLSNTLHLTVR